MPLSDKQKRFVIEYPIDSNGTQAAIRAGYSPATAGQQAFQLLQNPAVYAAIEERQREIAAAAALTPEWVLSEWRKIAFADPSELIRTEIQCCRHCYGASHEYQWTEFDYRKAVEAAHAHRCTHNCVHPCPKSIPPAGSGGFGYTPHRLPHAECPVCHGEGIERVYIADMRHVSGPARRLIAGVKKTKDGIEIKMRDQGEALKNIAQYLRMLVEPKELSGPNGGPIPIAGNVSAKDFTDDQLAAMLVQLQAEKKA